jgi:predicted DNA-binding protein YlxM (UPF0122 family)
MEDRFQLGYLLDMYGALLTPHQRSLMEQSIEEDLSLAEIAQREGVTRQAVSDTLKRAQQQLIQWETQLGFARKESSIRREISRMQRSAENMCGAEKTVLLKHLQALNDILEDEHGV